MRHLWRGCLVKEDSKTGPSGFCNKYENIWSLGSMVWLLVYNVCNSSLFCAGICNLLHLVLGPYRKIAFFEGKAVDLSRFSWLLHDFEGDFRGGRVSSTGQRIWLMSLKSNISVNKKYNLMYQIRATLEIAANYWIPLSHIFKTYTQLCFITGVVIIVNLKYSDSKRLSKEWKSAVLLNNI